jgi:diguanylate cyclase
MSSSADGPAPGWHRDPALGGLAALGAFVVVWYGLDLGGPVLQIIVCWATLTVLQISDVVLSSGIVRTLDISSSARRFWLRLTVTFTLFGSGSATELARSLVRPSAAVAGPSPIQLLTLGAGGLTLVVALLGYPLALTGARERRRYWLDAATVMVAAVIFAWYLGGPSGEEGVRSAAGLARGLVGPGIFVVIGFGLLKLMLTRNPPFTAGAAVVAGLATLIETLSTGLDHTLAASGHAAWANALGLTANVMLTLGLRVQRSQLRADAGLLRLRPARPYSRLPYSALAGTYALLVWELSRHHLTGRAWAVLAAAIVSTALVVLRQLAAFADNAALLHSLDSKIRELAETQIAMQHALDERDALAERLRHRADHDDLTGLATRSLFLQQIEVAMARSRRTGAPIVVLMIDLNDFKPVNDQLGHHAGDIVLQHVAERMMQTVRQEDIVARLGGDEFAILVENGSDPDSVAARVAAAVGLPVTIGAEQVAVRASIGMVSTDGDSYTAEALLQEADRRMYAAKTLLKAGPARG